jgi:putative membrane protein
MKTKSMTAGLIMAMLTTGITLAQQNSRPMEASSTAMVGKETKSEFDSQNQKGAAAVSAVTATPAKLSSADQNLMLEVSKGGMMQLEVSRLAVQKATSPEVRELAQAEVDEQTGLAAKLQEIASAKGVTLPTTPDADTQAMISKLQGMSGAAFDKAYVSESGVKGHQKLDGVMAKVESNASDSSLKGIGTAAHPLVKTHLQVARQINDKL